MALDPPATAIVRELGGEVRRFVQEIRPGWLVTPELIDSSVRQFASSLAATFCMREAGTPQGDAALEEHASSHQRQAAACQEVLSAGQRRLVLAKEQEAEAPRASLLGDLPIVASVLLASCVVVVTLGAMLLDGVQTFLIVPMRFAELEGAAALAERLAELLAVAPQTLGGLLGNLDYFGVTSHRASSVLTAFSLSFAMVVLQSVLQLSRRAKAPRTTMLALLLADVLFTGGFALIRFPPGEPIPNVALAVSAFELAVLVSHLVATGWAGDLLMRRREARAECSKWQARVRALERLGNRHEQATTFHTSEAARATAELERRRTIRHLHESGELARALVSIGVAEVHATHRHQYNNEVELLLDASRGAKQDDRDLVH